MKKIIRYTILVLLGCVFFLGCRPRKIISTGQKAEEKTAFYEFKLRYDSIHKKSVITLTNVKVVEIKLNAAAEESAAALPSNLLIEITDQEKNKSVASVAHPLFRKFDVFSPSGKIEAKTVSLPEADLTIRVPYYRPYKKIKITETHDKQINITILEYEK